MPRPTSPIRLQLDPGRIDKATGKRRPGYWLIRDGETRHRTGCREDDRGGAEVALQVYLAKRHLEAEPEPNRAASQILVADVLTYYAKEVVDGDDPVSRPKEFLARTDRLLSWWGTRNLAQVNGFTCKSYARDRGSLSSARRELEDMRAAIKLYHQDGLCRDLVPVVLPRKHRSRLTYFERDDVARLLWHCWRAREIQKGVMTDKRHLRHLIPFILTAVYTGSRSAKIWQAGYSRAADHAWIDLEAGVYHRLGTAQIEKANKRAGSVKIPDRLLVHMRRWQCGPLKDGVRVPRQWLCEYRGRPADPKGALARAMDDVFGEGHPYVRHTFRHTAASWLIWSGEKLDEIASYLSMTVEVLIGTYGHDHPEANLAIGQAFSTGRAGHRKGGQRGKSRRDRGLEHAEAAE